LLHRSQRYFGRTRRGLFAIQTGGRPDGTAYLLDRRTRLRSARKQPETSGRLGSPLRGMDGRQLFLAEEIIGYVQTAASKRNARASINVEVKHSVPCKTRVRAWLEVHRLRHNSTQLIGVSCSPRARIHHRQRGTLSIACAALIGILCTPTFGAEAVAPTKR